MKTVDELLHQMVARGASDLHIKAGSPPVIRVDGELRLLDEPASDARRHQGLRGLDHDRQADPALQRAQRDRLRLLGADHRAASASTSTASAAASASPCARWPPRSPRFEDLHLPEIIKRLALEPRGLVLVTGTTGSGKTTTLAAMIDHINHTMRRHIVTVEDPIEVLHKDRKSIINQREIGLDTEQLRDGAQVRAAPGPGRHPHRRDARHRRPCRRRSPRPRPATS